MKYCKLTLMLMNFYSSVIEYIGQPRDIKIMPEKQLVWLRRTVGKNSRKFYTCTQNQTWKWGKADDGVLTGVWPDRIHWGLCSSVSLLGTTCGCNGRIQEKQLEKNQRIKSCIAWSYTEYGAWEGLTYTRRHMFKWRMFLLDYKYDLQHQQSLIKIPNCFMSCSGL